MATKQLCVVTSKKKARSQLIVPDWLVGIMDREYELTFANKSMWSQYDHRFTQAPHTRYWLVVVNKHIENCYSSFIHMQWLKEELVKSYVMPFFKRDKGQYEHYLFCLK